LKIGLNATCINNRPSGARQRFVGIYGELFARLPDSEFVIYEPEDCAVASWFAESPNVSARRTLIPSEGHVRKLINGFGYWPSALRHERFDVFERFNLPIVAAPTGRTVLTIHDIRGVRPELRSFERFAHKLYLEKSLRSADHVITVSETMKEEILKAFPGISISVVYNGLEAQDFQALPENALQLVRQKYDLPQEFVLAVGHFEERKNYLRLIDAIARLRERGHSCCLVIVGNDSGLRNAIDNRIISLELDDRVRILCSLSDLEVRCIYKLCNLFVFPSAYEGFGIPILEAMAAGCPMVLSDIPVFREITEDRGVYFPHDDVDSMARAIDRVLSSSGERKRLVNYGNERVRDFSFDNLAAQVESVYRSLMA
jgi:glycosyltransferase involved in cell wall biosynthesis